MPVQRVLLALVAAVPLLTADLAPTGTLRAAFLATNPVQGRLDSQTGALRGPVGDLVPELARRIGVPYKLIPAPDPAAVIDLVKTHQADIGFIAYEAARASQVDFSAPYLLAGSTYVVRADSSIKSSADVDRAGISIGAAKGQSQQIWVSENIKNARVEVMPEMPANDVLVKMLVGGELDAFAANRQRMEDAARSSDKLRVLADNFMVVSQAIVVDKGEVARLEQANRFLADVVASGFVKASIDRAKIAGVEVAPVKP
jgi:polar amino acid transport system substrate-binding protein